MDDAKASARALGQMAAMSMDGPKFLATGAAESNRTSGVLFPIRNNPWLLQFIAKELWIPAILLNIHLKPFLGVTSAILELIYLRHVHWRTNLSWMQTFPLVNPIVLEGPRFCGI